VKTAVKFFLKNLEEDIRKSNDTSQYIRSLFIYWI